MRLIGAQAVLDLAANGETISCRDRGTPPLSRGIACMYFVSV
jgi:hypothetical protein